LTVTLELRKKLILSFQLSHKLVNKVQFTLNYIIIFHSVFKLFIKLKTYAKQISIAQVIKAHAKSHYSPTFSSSVVYFLIVANSKQTLSTNFCVHGYLQQEEIEYSVCGTSVSFDLENDDEAYVLEFWCEYKKHAT